MSNFHHVCLERWVVCNYFDDGSDAAAHEVDELVVGPCRSCN